MAFTPEDGSGLPDANSYASIAYADDYFALRNRSGWSALGQAEKEGHLVVGTDYIGIRWSGMFRSTKLNPEQALDFPRTAFGMPDEIVKAACEYAYVSAFGKLYNDMTTDSSGVAVIKTKEKLGPMEETFAAVAGAAARTYKTFPMADNFLRKYTSGSGRVYR